MHVVNKIHRGLEEIARTTGVKGQTWTRVTEKDRREREAELRGRGLLQVHMDHGGKLDLTVGLVWEDYEPQRGVNGNSRIRAAQSVRGAVVKEPAWNPTLGSL